MIAREPGIALCSVFALCVWGLWVFILLSERGKPPNSKHSPKDWGPYVWSSMACLLAAASFLLWVLPASVLSYWFQGLILLGCLVCMAVAYPYYWGPELFGDTHPVGDDKSEFPKLTP